MTDEKEGHDGGEKGFPERGGFRGMGIV